MVSLTLSSLLHQAWTRRLTPEKWLEVLTQYLDRRPEPFVDVTSELSDAYFSRIVASPVPSPLIVSYLETSLRSKTLPVFSFYKSLGLYHLEVHQLTEKQWNALLPVAVSSFSMLDRAALLEAEQTRMEAWIVLTRLAIAMCNLINDALNAERATGDSSMMTELPAVLRTETSAMETSDMKLSNERGSFDETLLSKDDVVNASAAAEMLDLLFRDRFLRNLYVTGSTQNSDYWQKLQTALSQLRSSLNTNLADSGSLNRLSSITRAMSSANQLMSEGTNSRGVSRDRYITFADEATGKTEPSAGIEFLMHCMTYVRPVMDSEHIVERLHRLQLLQGTHDHAFYIQVWIAALMGLADAQDRMNSVGEFQGQKPDSRPPSQVYIHHCHLWRTLILIKLPSLLKCFVERQRADTGRAYTSYDTKHSAMEMALDHLKGFRALFSSPSLDGTVTDHGVQFLDVVKACHFKNLVRPEFMARFGSITKAKISKFDDPKLAAVGIAQSPTLENISELRETLLSMNEEEKQKGVECTITLLDIFSETRDILSISLLCHVFLDQPSILDTILMMHPPSKLLYPLERYCNEWNVPEGEDTDTIIRMCEAFGKIFILIHMIVQRYELDPSSPAILQSPQSFACRWFHQRSTESHDAEVKAFLHGWVPALFGGSELSDDAIRQLPIRDFFMFAPLLCEQSLAACVAGVITFQTLCEGLGILLKPYLNHAVLGVLRWLCEEITFFGPTAILSLAVLKFLVLPDDGIPLYVLRLLGSNILTALGHIGETGDPELHAVESKVRAGCTFDPNVNAIRKTGDCVISGDQLISHSIQAFRAVSRGLRSARTCDAVISDQPHFMDVMLLKRTLAYAGPRVLVDALMGELLSAARSEGAVMRSAELLGSFLCFASEHHSGLGDQKDIVNPVTLFLREYLPNALFNGSLTYTEALALGWTTLYCLTLSSSKIVRMQSKIIENIVRRCIEMGGSLRSESKGVKEVAGPQTSGFLEGFLGNPELLESLQGFEWDWKM